MSAAIDAGVPETKARMIRLEARQAALETGAPAGTAPTTAQIFPLLILPQPNEQFTVLCENHELAAALEKDATLAVALKQRTNFDRAWIPFVISRRPDLRSPPALSTTTSPLKQARLRTVPHRV